LLLRRKVPLSAFSLEAVEAEHTVAAKVIRTMIKDYWLLLTKVGEAEPKQKWEFQESEGISPRGVPRAPVVPVASTPAPAPSSTPAPSSAPVPAPFLRSISYTEPNDLEEEIRILEEKKKSLEERKKERTQMASTAAQAQVRTRNFSASRVQGLESEITMVEKKLEEKRKVRATLPFFSSFQALLLVFSFHLSISSLPKETLRTSTRSKTSSSAPTSTRLR
jgi:hypothetical protein